MSKILIVANWDWVAYNFRLDLARALRDSGYSVSFVCPAGRYVSALQDAGFQWIGWSLKRRGLNPVGELNALWRLAAVYRRERPDIVHHDTIKPNLYGSLAVLLNRRIAPRVPTPRVLNSLMGVGYILSEHARARFLRTFVVPLLRAAMRRNYVQMTFSNRADLDTFRQLGIVAADQGQTMVSEFVDLDIYSPDGPVCRSETMPTGEGPVVLMAARLLWDKGVGQFAEAAGILKRRGVPVQWWLAGEPDEDAPNFVSRDELGAWDQEGLLHWLGHRSDMPSLLRRADVAVLPTHYNEGLPRFLTEAAATGLPLVATDIPACRRVVRHGENGFVVPARDARAFADAVEQLATRPELRKRMGAKSRARAVEHFSKEQNIATWLDLYGSLC